jgi:hypothetical protein
VAEIVEEISSSEYAIDHRLSRLRWMPLDRNKDDVQQMTSQLRQGMVRKKPAPT